MAAHKIPTPPPESKVDAVDAIVPVAADAAADAAAATGFSRVSAAQAAADAIPLLVPGDRLPYHLYHLTTPPNTRHHPPRLRSTWWRLRSRDLVHWTRDAQPSIVPSARADAPDADGAWTGAAVQGPGAGAVNIFYTGYSLQQGGKQVLLRTEATRGDADTSGIVAATRTTAFACPGTPIAFAGAGREMLEPVDFRDPFVFFHAGEQRYWMVVASRLARGPFWTRGCVALLTSPDLARWTFAPQPLHAPNDVFCPECPELFTLPATGKWYLVYSRFHAPHAGTVYRVADTPYGPFRVPRDGSHGRLDGRRWYAAKSCASAADPGTRVFFGWIGDYVDDEAKWLWGGDLAVPREVTAAGPDGCCLRIAPAAAAVAHALATSTPVAVDGLDGPDGPGPGARLVLASATPGTTSVRPLAALAATPAARDRALLVTVAFDVVAAADADAHAFGLVLQPDADDRGLRLQFTPAGPATPGVYSVALLADFPPLDDFWADQYDMHQPRPVDGPELVRHDGVVLGGAGAGAGGGPDVQLFLRRQLVEVFVGGRAISYRLPQRAAEKPAGAHDDDNNDNAAVPDDGHRLSWFVDDGSVTLANVAVRYGGRLDEIV